LKKSGRNVKIHKRHDIYSPVKKYHNIQSDPTSNELDIIQALDIIAIRNMTNIKCKKKTSSLVESLDSSVGVANISCGLCELLYEMSYMDFSSNKQSRKQEPKGMDGMKLVKIIIKPKM